jgi:hypothetical protein
MMLLFNGCGNTAGTPGANLNATESGNVSVEKEDSNMVTSPSEDDVTVEAEPTPEELELQEWQNYMMPDVDVALNVRVEPNVEAELAGKLRRGDRATVIEKGETWTKIKSGDVEGYVLTEYVLTGASAEAFAKDYVTLLGTVLENGVNIRAEKSTEADILAVMDKDDTITVTHKTYTASETAGSAANGTLASDGTGKFKVVNGISTE